MDILRLTIHDYALLYFYFTDRPQVAYGTFYYFISRRIGYGVAYCY